MNDQIEANESEEIADSVAAQEFLDDALVELHEQAAAHLDEARRQNDSPRIIAILEILKRMTDLHGDDPDDPDNCEHAHVEQGTCADCGALIVPVQNEAPHMTDPRECQHANLDPYGVCRDCMTCTHQFRDGDGVCRSCGDKAELEAQTQPSEKQSENEE
jgi:hypothetical protein